MQPMASIHQNRGAVPAPAATEIDLAFLEEFLGQDLDIDGPLIPTDASLDFDAPQFR